MPRWTRSSTNGSLACPARSAGDGVAPYEVSLRSGSTTGGTRQPPLRPWTRRGVAQGAEALGEFRGAGGGSSCGEGGESGLDDYAHHPAEVVATLSAAQDLAPGRDGCSSAPPVLADDPYRDGLAAAAGRGRRLRGRRLPGARGAARRSDGEARRPPLRAPAGDARRVGARSRRRSGGRRLARASRRPRAHGRRGRRGRRSAHPPRPSRVMEERVALSRFTTLGTGGPARWFARPERSRAGGGAPLGGRAGSPCRPVGLGSNLLVADEGSRAGAQARRRARGGGGARRPPRREWRRPARGLPPPRAVYRARRIEFACAIPGTAGGVVWMNRAPTAATSRGARTRARRRRGGDELEHARRAGLTYRRSGLAQGQIVAQVELRLEPRPVEIKATVARMQAQPKAAQPTNCRTFGSVFKNPEHELSAGRMLESCGLRGHPHGGADLAEARELHRERRTPVGRRGGADRRGPAPPSSSSASPRARGSAARAHRDRSSTPRGRTRPPGGEVGGVLSRPQLALLPTNGLGGRLRATTVRVLATLACVTVALGLACGRSASPRSSRCRRSR